MSMTPTGSTVLDISKVADTASTIRRQISGQPRQAASFGQTLDGVSSSLELSLANNFIQENGQEQSGGLNEYGQNVLSTLTRLARQEALASATREALPLLSAGAGSTPAGIGVLRYAALVGGGAGSAHAAGTGSMAAVEGGVEATGETADAATLGSLSSQFESGPLGSLSIGHDSVGGTSYGIYQLSSRQGTMKEFISFLAEKAPELAKRLKSAGSADTGGVAGRMPKVWKQIAMEQGSAFDDLQHQFIARSHYEPALQRVKELTGLDEESMPQALREVLFSTAVQHGPNGAGSIFARAARKIKAQREEGLAYLNKLVRNVYDVRAGQFGGSSTGVRNAVQSRLVKERNLALDMLKHDSGLSERMLA